MVPVMVVSVRHPDTFRRLLQRRPLARHAGWSLHGERVVGDELSTGHARCGMSPVDDMVAEGVPTPPAMVHSGVVLSRRHVRRAVSRNLMRRIWKSSLADMPADRIDGWTLVLRRTAAWDRADFPSAASDAMRRRLRADFACLLGAVPTRRRPDSAMRP